MNISIAHLTRESSVARHNLRTLRALAAKRAAA